MRLLHIANGHGTTGLIERSGVPGRTAIWADPLNEGPVPGNVEDDALLGVRARFLASHSGESDTIRKDLQHSRDLVADDSGYDELVLWFEHDLFDQLNLIQLLTFIGRKPRLTPLTLVSVDSYPGHPRFKGLGELAPADIATLFETRTPVSRAQITVAGRAWAAYRSPDPRAIESFLASETSALPFLARALARHLEEFPSEAGGLSRTERRLLQLAAEGPAPIGTVLPRMHDGETAHYIADSWFADRVTELSTVSPPLLRTIDGAIAIADAGRDVLGGRADRVRLCGIDRWLGGVHLEGRGPAWRWSGRGGRLVEA